MRSEVASVDGVTSDIKEFTKDTGDTLNEMNKEAGTQLKSLQKKTADTQAMLSAVYEGLRAQAKIQKAFPREAEKLLSLQKRDAAKEFGKMRDDQKATLETTFHDFGKEAKKQVDNSLKMMMKLQVRAAQQNSPCRHYEVNFEPSSHYWVMSTWIPQRR